MEAGTITIMWLVLLAVLLGIEIATMGLTTIWFAGGALIAFLLSLFQAPLWSQIAVFIALKYMNKGVEKTNVDSIPGQKGIVTQTIDNLKAEGQVTIQGMEWSARSKDESVIEEGKVVKVAAVEGVKLIVEEEK